jgi:hypothetical protein
MTRPTYAVLSAALALGACAAPVSPPASAPAPVSVPLSASGLTAEQAAATITPQDVYARIEFLASDRMRGRNTPSPELEIAASYLVNQYKLWGLQPGGENGTFYQWWPFRGRGAAAGTAGVPVPNVVAVLPGSDPALRNEYVVLSAHMDHVGVGRAVNGDSIYNGADDDASGTTGLLEVAEAFARMGVRPRRSIVFLHVSGEEKGLLGSAWYAEHPTVPLAQTVANVNVDMIGRNDPGMVVVIGCACRTTSGPRSASSSAPTTSTSRARKCRPSSSSAACTRTITSPRTRWRPSTPTRRRASPGWCSTW